MYESHIITLCAECQDPINNSTDTPENRTACPNFGSTRRKHDISLHLKGKSAQVSIKIKAKHIDQEKPHIELNQGPSYSHKLDKPVEHERLIDRGNDRHFEKVTNYENGELIHFVDEQLSEHTGHGTAKKKHNS